MEAVVLTQCKCTWITLTGEHRTLCTRYAGSYFLRNSEVLENNWNNINRCVECRCRCYFVQNFWFRKGIEHWNTPMWDRCNTLWASICTSLNFTILMNDVFQRHTQSNSKIETKALKSLHRNPKWHIVIWINYTG